MQRFKSSRSSRRCQRRRRCAPRNRVGCWRRRSRSAFGGARRWTTHMYARMASRRSCAKRFEGTSRGVASRPWSVSPLSSARVGRSAALPACARSCVGRIAAARRARRSRASAMDMPRDDAYTTCACDPNKTACLLRRVIECCVRGHAADLWSRCSHAERALAVCECESVRLRP